MQAYKKIIQSIGIDFMVFVHGRRLKRDSANVQTHQRRSRASPVRTLIVILPIFQISHKTFNMMRMFDRYDTLQ